MTLPPFFLTAASLTENALSAYCMNWAGMSVTWSVPTHHWVRSLPSIITLLGFCWRDSFSTHAASSQTLGQAKAYFTKILQGVVNPGQTITVFKSPKQPTLKQHSTLFQYTVILLMLKCYIQSWTTGHHFKGENHKLYSYPSSQLLRRHYCTYNAKAAKRSTAN